MLTRRGELAAWTLVAVALAALSIPWFFWGDATIVAGLPLWVWWHAGWLVLAAVVFSVFATRAWGLGVEPAPRRGDGADGEDSGRHRSGDPDARGGERR